MSLNPFHKEFKALTPQKQVDEIITQVQSLSQLEKQFTKTVSGHLSAQIQSDELTAVAGHLRNIEEKLIGGVIPFIESAVTVTNRQFKTDETPTFHPNELVVNRSSGDLLNLIVIITTKIRVAINQLHFVNELGESDVNSDVLLKIHVNLKHAEEKLDQLYLSQK